MIFIIIYAVIILFLLVLAFVRKDLNSYNHIGSAQPDDPNQENYPIIKGPQDALSQRIIDRALSKDDS